MDRRRVILTALFLLAAVAVVDVWLNGAGIAEEFGARVEVRVGSEAEPDAIAELEESYEVSSIQRVVLEGSNGRIHVEAAPVDEVRVAATVRIYAANGDSARAEEYARQLRLEASAEGGVLRPRVVAGALDGVRNVAVIWNVVVPEHLAVEAALGRGSVSVSGVQAPVFVRGAGDIDVSGIRGEVTVEADMGSVRVQNVEGNASVFVRLGDIDVAGVRGDVTLRLATGDVSVADVAGNVVYEGAMGAFEAARVSGTTRVKQDYGAVDIIDAAGPIHAEVGVGEAFLQPVAAAPITAAVSTGDLTLALPAALVPEYTFNLKGSKDGVAVRPEVARMMTQRTDGQLIDATVRAGEILVRLAE